MWETHVPLKSVWSELLKKDQSGHPNLWKALNYDLHQIWPSRLSLRTIEYRTNKYKKYFYIFRINQITFNYGERKKEHPIFYGISSQNLLISAAFSAIFKMKLPQCNAIGVRTPLDRGYPSFGNFDSTIPIDIAGMKSYMDSLFDPTCVPVRVTINKLNLAPNRNMPRFISVLRNRRGLSMSKLCQSCSFILSRIDLPVWPIYTLLHSHGILQTKPFCFVSSKASLGRTKWDLSVVSNSKKVCLDVVGSGEEPLIHPFM